MPILEELQIELSGVCNATCSYCTWNTRTAGRGLMKADLATSLIHEAQALGVGLLTFHGVGESTLHPNLLGIVGMADDRGMRTRLSSNCYRLEDKLARGLAELPNLEMILAIHWGLPIPFVGQAIANAQDYLALKPKNRSVEVLMVCAAEEANYAQRLIDEFLPLVERVPPARLHFKQPCTFPDSEAIHGAVPNVPEHPQIDLDRTPAPRSIGRGCRQPEYLLQIMADGTTAPCCVATHDWGLPRIQDAGIRGVWESPRMEELRRLWAAADDSVACGKCLKRTDC